jgi:hypothetical protein
MIEDGTPIDSDHAYEMGLGLLLDGLERLLPGGTA